MFWSTMAAEEREIDRKLKSDDPDLRSILEDIHCLQEIRNSNEALMAFLKSDENFRTLLGAILVPIEEENGGKQLKDRYKFVHQCCEALCIGAREFYPELEKHEDLLQKMTTFLADNSTRLNPLLVSLYSRVVMTFLSTEPEKFLSVLENSTFLQICMDGLENAALFELISTVANSAPDPVYRDRTKQWYVDKGFVQKLLALLSPAHSSAIHENVALLWIEFVRALRDFQYNVEQSPDPLLDSIQSEESVAALLDRMFPADGTEFSPSLVANGASILNVLLETNQIRNSPSQLLAQEMQGQANNNSLLDPLSQQNFSFNSTDNTISSSNQLLMDPKRIVETKCAEHAADIVNCIIYGLDAGARSKKGGASGNNAGRPDVDIPGTIKEGPQKLVDYDDSAVESNHVDDGDDFYGDVLYQCMQLLVNLTNTNFLPTHLELHRAFSNTPERSLSTLFEQVEANPSRSIFNAQLETLVLHILYSNTGGSQRPLIDFVIKDFNLAAFILHALDELISKFDNTSALFDMSKDNSVSVIAVEAGHGIPLSNRLCGIAKQSFFLHLGKRLFQSAATSPNAEYIDELMKELPNYEQWQWFCGNFVQSFIDQNRSEKVNSMATSTRTSNVIEIDELPDDNMLPSMSLDPQNIYGEFQELKLDPLFSSSGLTTAFSPKTLLGSSPFIGSPSSGNNKTVSPGISPNSAANKGDDKHQEEEGGGISPTDDTAIVEDQEPPKREAATVTEGKDEGEAEEMKPPPPLTDLEANFGGIVMSGGQEKEEEEQPQNAIAQTTAGQQEDHVTTPPNPPPSQQQ